MSNRKTGRPVGRPKGAISAKRRMAHEVIATLEKELGKSCHPLEGLLRLASDESQSVELRATCYRDALPYVLPRLQQQSVSLSGPNDGPVEIATLDVGDLITHRPELAAALVEASLLLTEQEAHADRIERGLPEPRLIDMPEYR
jgi:hypothetical protein